MMTDSVNTVNLLEKSNMMLLTKELNEKDRNLKSQLLTSINDAKTPSESFWSKIGFFRDVKSDFNLRKIDFPEKALIYINQAHLAIKKTPIIYCSYVIFGQIIPHFNPPQDLDNYVCKENEIKIFISLYGTADAKYKGIKTTLVNIDWR